MFKKYYALFGIVTPLVYLFAVVLGGFIMPDYSHTYNTISELTGAGFPDIVILDLLFFLYNLLLVAFAIGGLVFFQPVNVRLARILFLLLLAAGMIGLLFSFFPQDMRGAPPTASGKIHIILAGIISPITVASAIIAGFTFKSDPIYQALSPFSFVMGAEILATGGATAISIAVDSPFGGVFERLTIGAFLFWLLFLAATITRLHQKGE
jgi:hypothetical membrane protein